MSVGRWLALMIALLRASVSCRCAVSCSQVHSEATGRRRVSRGGELEGGLCPSATRDRWKPTSSDHDPRRSSTVSARKGKGHAGAVADRTLRPDSPPVGLYDAL